MKFFDLASAGSASFTHEGSAFATATSLEGGRTEFHDTSTAATATFLNRAGIAPNGHGGRTYFYDHATGGAARLENEGGVISNGWAGVIRFFNQSNADFATILNRGTSVAGAAEGGAIYFNDTSSANRATIENFPGAVHPGVLTFFGRSTASHANIFNRAALVLGEPGGGTVFSDESNAGNATIVNETGGSTRFGSLANAASATLIARSGGYVAFFDRSRGGDAILDADGGGGSIHFGGDSDGERARLILRPGEGILAWLDMTALTTGMSLGSIEGAGSIFLGTKRLSVGENNLSTTFAGTILGDPGCVLAKNGIGMLTLSGANTYPGTTLVNSGTLAINGSIPGGVLVRAGATLKGTGTIGGPVVVLPGGVFSPGASPGAITVGGLELSDTSILDYELGAAASDQTIVNGNLILDGILNIANAGGISAGGRYELFRWTGTLTDHGLAIGSVPPGFNPSDFHFEFAGGAVRLAVDRGGVTPVNVTSSLQIEGSGFRLNRTTQRFVQTLTVRNASTLPITGPVSLILDLLSPNATLHAPSGATASLPPLGSAFVDLDVGDDGVLSAGEITTLNLEFSNASNQPITYTLRVLAGPGER